MFIHVIVCNIMYEPVSGHAGDVSTLSHMVWVTVRLCHVCHYLWHLLPTAAIGGFPKHVPCCHVCSAARLLRALPNQASLGVSAPVSITLLVLCFWSLFSIFAQTRILRSQQPLRCERLEVCELTLLEWVRYCITHYTRKWCFLFAWILTCSMFRFWRGYGSQ